MCGEGLLYLPLGEVAHRRKALVLIFHPPVCLSRGGNHAVAVRLVPLHNSPRSRFLSTTSQISILHRRLLLLHHPDRPPVLQPVRLLSSEIPSVCHSASQRHPIHHRSGSTRPSDSLRPCARLCRCTNAACHTYVLLTLTSLAPLQRPLLPARRRSNDRFVTPISTAQSSPSRSVRLLYTLPPRHLPPDSAAGHS